MEIINLKSTRDICPPQIRDADKTEFKIRDMVLLKTHTQMNAFDSKYKPSFRMCTRISDKAFDV